VIKLGFYDPKQKDRKKELSRGVLENAIIFFAKMLQPYILVFDLFTSSRNLQGKIRCYFGRVAAVLIPRTRYSKILNPTRVLFRIFVAEMGLMLGMEAKQKRKKIKRLFGTQPGCPKRPKLVRATPWADFVVIGDQV